MLPASAVPLKVGVLSLVGCPEVTGCEVTSLMTVDITGEAGAMVSTLTTKPVEGTLTLPAASVAVTVRVCEPSPRLTVGVKVQTPRTLAVAVPITTPLSRMFTVEPASAVPLRVGFGSLVAWPLVSPPTFGRTASTTVRITGCAGGMVSTIMLYTRDGTLVSRPTVWVAVKVCGP